MYVIEVDRVSKKFRRHSGLRGTTTLMSYILHDMHNPQNGRREFFWALKEISLKVPKGETFGIIGPNGSGKSTLLQLINGILKPDGGTVAVRGDIAALTHLGAGFHPDLSGRENVLINGVVLGMTRNQIRAKFDEIIEFAELQDFIDEPVRTYSTGMAMRLGFSVAVHVDPEILLLDEVFSVGDAAFSKKCIARMDLFKQAGKTIVVATHDLDMVKSWCDAALWLDKGAVRSQGDPLEVAEAYRKAQG